MTPRASAQILPLDGSAEHLLGLLEVGSERRAEGTLRGTDLEDPKEVEEDARPLNALCKRLSEDAVSRKVRPFPGRWAPVPRMAQRHPQRHVHACICSRRAEARAHSVLQLRGSRPVRRALPVTAPDKDERAGQGLRPPHRPDPGPRAGWDVAGKGQGLGGGGPHRDECRQHHGSVHRGAAEIPGSGRPRAGGRALPRGSV